MLNANLEDDAIYEKNFEEGIEHAQLEEEITIPKSQYDDELKLAYERGLEEGKSKGYQDAEAQFKSDFETTAKVLQHLEKDKARIIQQAENLLIELALKIVGKIVSEIPEIFPKLIKKTINNVLQYLSNEPIFTLYLNPEDLEDFTKLQNDFEKVLPGLEKLSIKKDARLVRGGCIIETENGKIDARIDTQINKITQALRKELKLLPT
jgi:flagellar assembly protein FliH